MQTPSVRKHLKEALPSSVVEWLSVIRRYRKHHGRLPNIINPKGFNDKVVHRLLFDRREVLREMTDKVAVRKYVEARLGPETLPKLYCLTPDPEKIAWEALPDRFVVKPSHGSGWVRVVTDKSRVDWGALIRTCKDWMSRSYYNEWRVWYYKNIEPRIMVEQFIDDGSGEAPIDYKLFVFDGVVEIIQVDVARFTGHRRRFYTPAWEPLDVLLARPGVIGDVPRPPHLAGMIAAAEKLSEGIDFVRADFYDTPAQPYFGELTPGPGGGTSVSVRRSSIITWAHSGNCRQKGAPKEDKHVLN
jgi:hypothetical protein